MSARFVYWMNVSLDLRIERTTGENGGGDWLRIDEALHREFNRRARAMTMMIQGRVVYDIMASFWPAAAENPELDDYVREYGEIWTTMPKILVSTTRNTAGHNTRVIGGDDVVEQLRRVRAEGVGDIGVGGANLATALLDAHLLDELLLITHPTVLGEGRPLFDHLSEPLQLDLLEHGAFSGDVELHRYAVPGAQ